MTEIFPNKINNWILHVNPKKIILFAVIEEKREPIFQEALKELGPPDGSILLQFEDAIGKKHALKVPLRKYSIKEIFL